MSNLVPIRRAALNLLARREHAENELKIKLRQKGFPEADIDTVITKLVSEKLLSNFRFIEMFIHHRANKGYGPLRIRLELIQKGLPEDLIDHHLNMADNIWLAQAHKVWQKKFKGLLPRDYKTRAQQMRFLQYRGFTPDQIDSIFSDNDNG